MADGFGNAGNSGHSYLHGRALPSSADGRDISGRALARRGVGQPTATGAPCGMARGDAIDTVGRRQRGEGQGEDGGVRRTDGRRAA